MLEDVKKLLGITGIYQDDTIQGYIDEVNAFLIDGGVKQEHITPGLVARGVSDLWSYESGQGEFSAYFIQRAAQRAYKGN